MITFGFKSKKNIYWRAGAAFLLGLSFIIITIVLKGSKYGLFDVLVMTSGIGLAAVGIFELIYSLFQKDRSSAEKVWMISGAVTFIVLGVVLCCLAKFIMGAFCAILGLILLLFGLYEVIVLISAVKVLRFSAAFFVLPAVVAICGALVFVGALLKSKGMQDLMCYAAGISLMVFSISEIIAMRRIEKAMAAAGPDEQKADVRTVDQTTADEQ